MIKRLLVLKRFIRIAVLLTTFHWVLAAPAPSHPTFIKPSGTRMLIAPIGMEGLPYFLSASTAMLAGIQMAQLLGVQVNQIHARTGNSAGMAILAHDTTTECTLLRRSDAAE